MAVQRKTLSPENLEKYSVFIEDTDISSKYFKITELSDTFSGGKNAFLIQGSDYLVPDTIVKIEIKDSLGDTIYYEPGEGIPEYYEGTSKVVAVYVYPDTAYGPCTITILGELATYDDNGTKLDIPPDWQNTYNVRWQTEVNVNPSLPNTTKIRFYKRPEAIISEVLKPVFTISETYITQTGNVTLTPIVPDPGTLYTDFILSGQLLDYRAVLQGGVNFTTNMLNQTMSFASYPDYSPKIIEILSSTTAKLDTPLIENGYVNTTVTPYSITYLSGSDRTQSSFTSSYANIKLNNLETFAGDAKRVKVFRKSKGSISDYELVQDILLESKELLTTYDGTQQAVENVGFFTTYILSKYWNTTGTLTKSLNNERLPNAVLLNGSGSFVYTSSVDLTAKTVYELQFDSFYSASSDSNLEIYVSGSTTTDSSSIREVLIGTLNGLSPTRKFENNIIQFSVPFAEPSASLYFKASQGKWYLSDVSLTVSQETAFSPDSITFLTSVPTSVPNEIFQFKFEFYDVNNNYVPVNVVAEQTFTGGTNTVVVINQIISSSVEASSSLLAVSQSISGTMTVYSSSASSSISQSIYTSSLYTSASVYTLSGSVSGTIGVLSGSVSGSIYTLSGSVSSSLTALSSSLSSSIYLNTSQSLYTVYSASAFLDRYIFTDTTGKLRRPPTASVTGLYTGDTYLGFYDGGVWKTFMDNSGNFYLTSSIVGGGFLAWASSLATLQIQGQINIQEGGINNAATKASVTSSINFTSASLSASLDKSIFTTSTGLIAKPPSVLVGSTSGLYLGSSYMGYYDGAGWKTFMANNGNFYLSGSGGDSLTWASGVLTINGAINVTGGNVQSSLTSLNNTSASLNNATSSLQSQITSVGTYTGSIFTNNAGLINKAATPSGAGLYLGSSYMGYYNASAWKTYMSSSGDFYLSGAGNNGLTWIASTGLLSIDGNITARNGTFIGNITSTATISGGTVSGGTITGGTITGNSISGNSISGGSITGSIISASSFIGATGTFSGTLSAANGFFNGTITAIDGTIGGWTINSASLASSGSVIVLDSNGRISINSGSGAPIVLLNNGQTFADYGGSYDSGLTTYTGTNTSETIYVSATKTTANLLSFTATAGKNYNISAIETVANGTSAVRTSNGNTIYRLENQYRLYIKDTTTNEITTVLSDAATYYGGGSGTLNATFQGYGYSTSKTISGNGHGYEVYIESVLTINGISGNIDQWRHPSMNFRVTEINTYTELNGAGLQAGESSTKYIRVRRNASNINGTSDTMLEIGGSANLTGDVVANTSDRRLKTNIRTINSPLEKISKINGIHFNWNETAVKFINKNPNINEVGLIAQEVKEVLPEIVKNAPFDSNEDGTSKTGENYLTVQYEKLVPLLVEAIKELKSEVEELKKNR